MTSERLTADISHDLRASAQDMRAEHRNTDAGLLAEAADKLDGLIALLAEAADKLDGLIALLAEAEAKLRDEVSDEKCGGDGCPGCPGCTALTAERDRLREDWEYRGHQLDDAATVGRALIAERDRLAETTEETLRRLCVLAGYESDAYDEGEQGLGPKVTMADALDDIQERISLLQGALKLADQNWRTRKAENEQLAAELAEIRAALTDGLTGYERDRLTEPAAITAEIRALRAALLATTGASSRLAATVQQVWALTDPRRHREYVKREFILAALDRAQPPEAGEPGSNLGADDPDAFRPMFGKVTEEGARLVARATGGGITSADLPDVLDPIETDTKETTR